MSYYHDTPLELDEISWVENHPTIESTSRSKDGSDGIFVLIFQKKFLIDVFLRNFKIRSEKSSEMTFRKISIYLRSSTIIQ